MALSCLLNELSMSHKSGDKSFYLERVLLEERSVQTPEALKRRFHRKIRLWTVGDLF